MANLERYSRQMLLPDFGKESQIKLSQSAVLVIGAGGLGCPVLQILVSAGVGKIGIVDFDVVDLHNLHRQFLYEEADVGLFKTAAAKSRLEKQNTEVDIRLFTEKLTAENADRIIREFDVVVDSTDNFSTRYLANDVCFLLRKPLVYGAIFRYEGQVAVFHKEHDGAITSYRDLFPTAPRPDEIPDCQEAGVLPTLTAIIGGMQAQEVIKILTDAPNVLIHKLLLFNVQNYQTTVIQYRPLANKLYPQSFAELKSFDYALFCGVKPEEEIQSMEELTQFLALDNSILVDVREIDEQPVIVLDKLLRIPLSTIASYQESLGRFDAICFVCAAGVRSKKALTKAELLFPDKIRRHIPKGIKIFES